MKEIQCGGPCQICCLCTCTAEGLYSLQWVASEICVSGLSDACSRAKWLLLVAVQDLLKQHASLK